MADDTENVLRRSLDAVDRHRQRLVYGLIATVVLLLVTFFLGIHAVYLSTEQAFVAHFVILLMWMTALTLVVVIQITVMTKRVLRAIELATRR
jgi:cobalamin biosynthesis protein CobD/CbiB